MKNNLITKASIFITILFAQVSIFAAPMTFDLSWSGESFGNSASAVAVITLDDDLLDNPGNNNLFSGYVTNFTISVFGTASGDGTWTLADFSDIIFQADTALDFSQELIGQGTTMDPWGTSVPGATGGDFNIFASTLGAPNGTWFFELSAFSGEQMLLNNFTPTQVPVPGAAWLLLSGLAALRFKTR